MALKEFKELSRNREVDRHSNLNALAPFLDKDNILRVGGRLEPADIAFDAKHPILLPYNDPVTRLIFEQSHKDTMHCGPQAATRQRYWTIKGKQWPGTLSRNVLDAREPSRK